MSTRTRALIAIIIAGLLGGVSPIFSKIALTEFTPFQIVFIRFLLAFFILFPIALFTGKLSFDKKDFPYLLCISLLFAGNVLFFVVGLQYTTSIISQLFYLLTPALVIIFSFIFLRHNIEKRHLLSIGVGFAGGLLLIVRSGSTLLVQSLGNTKGNILILMAVCCWALYVTLSKKLSQKYTPLSLVVVVNGVTALLAFLLLSFRNQNIVVSLSRAHPIPLVNLICLVVLNSILFFFLYQWAIKLVKPFSVSLSSYLGVLASALLAVPLFGEKITLQLAVSGLLIGISSYLTFKKR
jgi:drug/metabolite transporter (DMT)-like permease